MARSDDGPDRLANNENAAPITVQSDARHEDEELSAEEEQFVAAFVDYWIRRGAQTVRVHR